MNAVHNQISAEGLERLRGDLEVLRTTERAKVAEAIKVAREFGDISENAEYDAAKNEQALLEQRIALLEDRILNARVVNGSEGTNGEIAYGAKVRIRDERSSKSHDFELVGSLEADAAAGRISVASPIGRALLGARKGETVFAETPRGRTKYKVLRVA